MCKSSEGGRVSRRRESSLTQEEEEEKVQEENQEGPLIEKLEKMKAL